MYRKEDNSGPKNKKGDNSMEILHFAGQWYSLQFDS